MTSLPAKRFKLAERGELREGWFADIVVFDPERIEDIATYEEPRQYPRRRLRDRERGGCRGGRQADREPRRTAAAAGTSLMAVAEEIFPFIYAVPLGYVNAFLLADPDGPTLVDSGLKGNYKRILQAIREIGRKPEELRHVLVTHHHADHVGSLAALIEKSGAQAWVHPLDAPIVAGEKRRPHPNPGSIAGRILGPVLERLPHEQPVARRRRRSS